MKIAFVEAKTARMDRIGALLEQCRTANRWANRGPLYMRLATSYSDHFGLDAQRAATPCASGGVALEAMARLLAREAGRTLRWVGSAFSFQNLGRGYFADMAFVDCVDDGSIDVAALRALDTDSFDGVVAVNPLGLRRDFSDVIAFARETGKPLLIDNAAGLDQTIPDWPWQSFSLHHTKPYGMGEGGLAVTPADAAEEVYALLDYGHEIPDPSAWLNNGKISDISCAFQIDRLERVEDWAPLYRAQAERVAALASEFGLLPLRPVQDAPPATSWAFVAEDAIPIDRIRGARRLAMGKYYRPLAERPQARRLYDRIVNIPTHPDVSGLSDDDLRAEMEALVAPAAPARTFATGSA